MTRTLRLRRLFRLYEKEAADFLGKEIYSVNQFGGFGNTPLHIAVTRDDLEEVELLLQFGADPNAQGELGNTPFHTACLHCHPAIIRLLLINGAKTTIPNHDLITPRQIAEMSNCKHLLEAETTSEPSPRTDEM